MVIPVHGMLRDLRCDTTANGGDIAEPVAGQIAVRARDQTTNIGLDYRAEEGSCLIEAMQTTTLG